MQGGPGLEKGASMGLRTQVSWTMLVAKPSDGDGVLDCSPRSSKKRTATGRSEAAPGHRRRERPEVGERARALCKEDGEQQVGAGVVGKRWGFDEGWPMEQSMASWRPDWAAVVQGERTRVGKRCHQEEAVLREAMAGAAVEAAMSGWAGATLDPGGAAGDSTDPRCRRAAAAAGTGERGHRAALELGGRGARGKEATRRWLTGRRSAKEGHSEPELGREWGSHKEERRRSAHGRRWRSGRWGEDGAWVGGEQGERKGRDGTEIL